MEIGASAPSADALECRDWIGHVIVCGLNDVALRTVEQLHLAGARVVVLSDEPGERLVRIVRGWGIPHLPRGGHLSEPLFDAGIAGASAVVCAESTDLRTLETVLQIRDLRPDVHVVADLDNPSVAHALEGVLRSVGVLDVAALFAPAVVETCVGRRAREIELGGTSFVTAEVIAPREGTLRELYGSLAPIGVVTEADDELIACPGRDQPVSARDRVTLLGTRAELDAAGLTRQESGTGGTAAAAARARSFLERQRSAIAGIIDRPLRIALLLGLVLLVISTIVLHFAYHEPLGRSHLSLLDAVYFTVETVATVGFGDYSFASQPTGHGRVRHLPDRRRRDADDDDVRALDERARQPPPGAVARARADSRHARARRARRPRQRRHEGARRAARRRRRGRRDRADGEQPVPDRGARAAGAAGARRRDARAHARLGQPLGGGGRRDPHLR